ncbi:transglycosylase domain-containing protein [Dactylosporangium matsuzakiense]|uniref:Penicillin-binding protein 1A n=1 Tax=Dactylosporangium matsuzakiense TaxID=53360 RepID=A0A9W6KIN2_9ACTN|nr:transglycosylase domain-containing protein [Dactylosporangium matsuzakiense]UWZ47517.1 penicillin-binding protein [Dactylosporangium matsuzakiense]GLL01657.1 penicillin-binding protein 1A [Dactylosporangium matsuzakiense]
MNRKKLLVGAAVIVVLLGAAAAAAGIYVAGVTPSDLGEPGGSTDVLYSDGSVMFRNSPDDQVAIDTTRLPGYVADAVIAAQDPGFREGHWFGRPTRITVQLTRTLAGNEHTGSARLQAVAARLENHYGRDVVLDRYLNTMYFGRQAYGIEAAAQAYYDKPAATLSPGEAVVLAAQLDSPGDGAYDPTVHADAARARFEEIRKAMTGGGTGVVYPEGTTRTAEDSGKRHDALRPKDGAGLIAHLVLDEFNAIDVPREGARITTTIDPKLQHSLLGAVGAAMGGQPANLQAAAVAVQPGTGRVLAYYGGERGTGVDYAALAHPAGNAFVPITVAAALKAGISLESKWQAPAEGEFPAAGRTIRSGNPVRDGKKCPGGKPACTLLDVQRDGLKVPLFAVAMKAGPDTVIDMARAAGIGTMWSPVAGGEPKATPLDKPGRALYPSRFGIEVGFGQYPVKLIDQASAMATFAAGGSRATTHFIAQITYGSKTLYRASDRAEPAIDAPIAQNVAWAMTQQPAGRLADGRPTALAAGEWPLTNDVNQNANAMAAGFAPQVAVAVWVGNKTNEQPLLDKAGTAVTGTSLPAAVYRQFVGSALGTARTDIDRPELIGDPKAGNA